MLEGRVVFNTWISNDGTRRSKHMLKVDTLNILNQ